MPIFLGVGQRIKERLVAIGYTRPNGDLRVQDFAADHRFPSPFVWDWMADRRTPLKDLERLATALQTTPAWLCFGVSQVIAPAGPSGDVIEAQGELTRSHNARRSDRALPAPLPVRRATKVTPKPQRRSVKKIAAIRGGSDGAPSQPIDGKSSPNQRNAAYQTRWNYREWLRAA